MICRSISSHALSVSVSPSAVTHFSFDKLSVIYPDVSFVQIFVIWPSCYFDRLHVFWGIKKGTFQNNNIMLHLAFLPKECSHYSHNLFELLLDYQVNDFLRVNKYRPDSATFWFPYTVCSSQLQVQWFLLKIYIVKNTHN